MYKLVGPILNGMSTLFRWYILSTEHALCYNNLLYPSVHNIVLFVYNLLQNEILGSAVWSLRMVASH